MTDGFGVSAQSCTYGAWLKVHVKCTGMFFSFATNVDDSCVLKRALIPSKYTIAPANPARDFGHACITKHPRYSCVAAKGI